MRDHGIDVIHNYQDTAGAIPLPATMSMAIGAHIAQESERAFSFRLYSDYPFPWRKDGGPHDEFEREALAALQGGGNSVFYLVEEHQGAKRLRYAKSDLMRQSCVNCHNSHPQTPKSDWAVGDLRGVLEVTVPVVGYENEKMTSASKSRFALIFFLIALFGIVATSSSVIANLIKR